MKMIPRFAGGVAVVALVLFSMQALAIPADEVEIDRPIVDYSQELSETTVDELEQRLTSGHPAIAIPIAVLVVNSTQGEPIEDYSRSVVAKWGKSFAEQDEKILVTLAIDDGRHHIEVGRDQQLIFPDSRTARISDSVRPYLRDENYDRAVEKAVDQLSPGTHSKEHSPGVESRPPIIDRRFIGLPLLALLAMMFMTGVGVGALSGSWLEKTEESRGPKIWTGFIVFLMSLVSGLPLLHIARIDALGVYMVAWLLFFGLGWFLRASIGQDAEEYANSLVMATPVLIVVFAMVMGAHIPLAVLTTPTVLCAGGILHHHAYRYGQQAALTYTYDGSLPTGDSSSSLLGGDGGGGASGSW